MAKKKRLLSGTQPTGMLHLGNYLGALANWVELQKEYDSFFMVADYHALTAPFNHNDLADKKIEVVAEWIAAGLDPKTSTMFIQSHVPEHAELSLILGMITPISWLERVPTLKEKMTQFP